MEESKKADEKSKQAATKQQAVKQISESTTFPLPPRGTFVRRGLFCLQAKFD
ncbi:hypothetical protein HUN82_09810 [Prosthecochloris sp. DSM 1685]|uniref:hypothetical protein n=1 Tax=Prosthecochloris ethylica TaxID=2743976 RepID=UPI0018831B0F|nr:hypothetical protein [Prosthecochloris ethylica]NUK48421.1 hypothetical protein [Prosthecochloris ethylica]